MENQTHSGDGLSSHALFGRLSEITQELCADYPNIATVEPWEQLYALEQSYRGTNAANADLHAVIEKLRIRCGMTKEEVADLGWPNVKVWHGGENGCQSEAKEGRCSPLPLPSCSESSSLVDGITSDGCSTSADTPESTPLPELPGWPLAQLPEHEHEWPQPVPPHPIVHVSLNEIENCPLCQCIAAPTDPADSSQ
jgi:Zn finger protein HypA/HybF involved in hydrogenase expression